MKTTVAQLWITLIITAEELSWIQCLQCDELLKMPADHKLYLMELQTMPTKEIVECLAYLSKEPLAPEEADYIWQSIITFHAGIANIPDKVLMVLHYVTVAVQPDDYTNMSLSNIDVIENFGLDYKLDQAQLTAIANRVQEDFAGKGPEEYTFYDLLAMRHILCQFNRSYIERIHPSAYREAALTIGKLNNCGSETMAGFASLAVQASAFGPPTGWTLAIVDTLGKVADFLPPQILKRIKNRKKSNAKIRRQIQDDKIKKYYFW